MSCESCNNCEGCNSCEGCYRCEGCNTCEGCDQCEKCDHCESDQTHYPCVTEQRHCEVLNDNLAALCSNTFKFSPCPEKDATLMGPEDGQFNKASWDAICNWIDQRKDYGIFKSGGEAFAESDTSDVSPFKASEFRRVANELSASTNGIVANSLIKGSYFKDLETAAAEYKIDGYACDYCNQDCDTKCDACVKCNVCEVKCNTGDSDCSDSNCYNRGERKTCEDTKTEK